MFPALAATTAVAMAVLVWAEWKHSKIRLIAKPLASAGFVAAALQRGAFDSTYGRILLLGLVLAAIGDVLLLGSTRRMFLAGLVSFLLGHVAYGVAFSTLGLRHGTDIDFIWTAAVSLPIAAVSYVVFRWLKPHLSDDMRSPVLAYVLVITVMVLTAFFAVEGGATGLILVGAVGFFLSDLAVARNLVVESITNRVWGLPLYYAAQLVLAWTAGT
ncbi:MAG: lysoplasmalogenase [Acidimicrobiia bacterium]|nr:lysoplasmalogenase [Acidimicrobiia bacterium]